MSFCWIKGYFLTDLDYFMLNYNKKFFIDYIAPIRNHGVMKKYVRGLLTMMQMSQHPQ